jgi:preprotein translocase subunit SecE
MQRLIEFLKEARAELGKVSWPTRKELSESTVLVIVSVILVTIFIGAVDFVFNKLLQWFAQSI